MKMTVYSRVMGVVLLAAGVTIGLFLVMKVLVTGQEYEIEGSWLPSASTLCVSNGTKKARPRIVH